MIKKKLKWKVATGNSFRSMTKASTLDYSNKITFFYLGFSTKNREQNQHPLSAT